MKLCTASQLLQFHHPDNPDLGRRLLLRRASNTQNSIKSKVWHLPAGSPWSITTQFHMAHLTILKLYSFQLWCFKKTANTHVSSDNTQGYILSRVTLFQHFSHLHRVKSLGSGFLVKEKQDGRIGGRVLSRVKPFKKSWWIYFLLVFVSPDVDVIAERAERWNQGDHLLKMLLKH